MKAIATVTSKHYLEGTKVLLHSFRLRNKKFMGDLVVIHYQLPLKDQKDLYNLFQVKFHEVSEQLVSKVGTLVEEFSMYQNKYQRFWSIETFNLSQYNQVIFLDSDILCRGAIDRLWTFDASFSACPDIFFYENKIRSAKTFLECKGELNSSNVFNKSFNSGVFLINYKSLQEGTYQSLLNMLNPSTFMQIKSGHTDQLLLNVYFKDKVNWLDVSYNYYLSRVKLLSEKMNVLPHQAVFLHYIRHPKPWKLKQILKKRIMGEVSFDEYRQWHLIYQSILMVEIGRNLNFKKLINLILSKILFK